MPSIQDIIINMANERIPVAAIARVTTVPAEQVREVIDEAVKVGRIIDVPPADWVPNSNMGVPPRNQTPGVEAYQRTFKLTKLEGSFLMVLVSKDEVAKEMLHSVIEQQRLQRTNRPDSMEPTDPKMVDVVICKLRKKLSEHSVDVKTIWGHGYYIEDDDRKKISAVILARTH